jgi:hypothetical protein
MTALPGEGYANLIAKILGMVTDHADDPMCQFKDKLEIEKHGQEAINQIRSAKSQDEADKALEAFVKWLTDF